MSNQKTMQYAQTLSKMIQAETISSKNQTDLSKFYTFHDLLRSLFSHLFSVCTFEDFDGSFLLCWKGTTAKDPVLFMNHHDVVEAPGEWKYPPFSGTIAEGKLWGRGTLDTKGPLWAMLQAADELVESGFQPKHDIYFLSACTEEIGGAGADLISETLSKRNIRFSMVLDEGGMILHEPISGANGTFAMVGLGEKGYADLKFIARSSGGHASTPGKNTPLVRLGQFMAEVDRSDLFTAEISPAVCEMFLRLSKTMKQPLRFVLGHIKLFKPILLKLLPKISVAAGAMLKTTLAFTMACGSDGPNVLPQEAWVIGNMRFSHHQGGEKSIQAVKKIADRYHIETVVLTPGFTSPISDFQSEAFHRVERAVGSAFPDVITTPYLMNAASDSRFLSRVCDHCLRFAPFLISKEQMESIHGINENVDLSALSPAVDFYRFMMSEV